MTISRIHKYFLMSWVLLQCTPNLLLCFSVFLMCICGLRLGKNHANAMNVLFEEYLSYKVFENTHWGRNHINTGNVQRLFHQYLILNDIWKYILKRNHICVGIVPKFFKENNVTFFFVNIHLMGNFRIQPEEKPYQCRQCPKTFSPICDLK